MQASVTVPRVACPPAQRAYGPARHSCRALAVATRVQHADQAPGPPTPAVSPAAPLHRLAAAALTSAALALAPMAIAPAYSQTVAISNDTPVVDLARVVPSSKLEGLQQQLLDLERDTGWRVRMLTRIGPSSEPTVEQIRAGWSVDERTVVVFVDPTAPNIMNFKYGRGLREVLRPQFFTELQSRYGNMFNVRDEGESAAVMGMMDSLTTCLAQGGCFAVPGLSLDHYGLTLAMSLAGGVIAGSAVKIEPSGFVQRRWVWVALFAPLWATLFINFGIAPVISRTPDLLPVIGNVAGFAVAAALVAFSPQVAKATGLSVDESDAA